jgi:DNA-binding winged helix-turn-helix (wHTH) protein/tetratricopeptide (TPR) repeat protein
VVTGPQSVSYGVLDLVIDPTTGTVTRQGDRIPLPPKTFELLLALVRHAPDLVKRHDLIDTVWPDEHVTEQTLSRRVFLLRHSLGDDVEHPRYVAGERGWGYRLVPPVEALDPEARCGGRGRWRFAAGVTAVALAATAAVALVRPSCGAGAGFTPPGVVQVKAFTAPPSDADLAWLAAHLTRAARDRLRDLPGVQTVSGETRGPPDVALSGVVERQADGLVLGLRLENGRSRHVAWSRSFTGSAQELLLEETGLATAAAQAVARELGLPAPLEGPPEAEGLCLRGLYLWGTWTQESLRQALEAFERASGMAPHLGSAAAGESLALATLALQGEGAPQERLREAREAASRALRLAPALPLAQTAVALVRLLADDDLAGAERAARRAVEAEPADAVALVGLALVLQAGGRYSESLPLLQRAGQADPLSACIPLLLGRALLAGGRAGEATASFERAASISPSLPAAQHGLAEARAAVGRDREALVAELAEWRLEEVSPAELIALERAFASGGLPALRRRACHSQELERRVPADAVRACAAVGDTTRAVALLARAAEERRPDLRLLAQEPALERLRSDERVRALLARPAPPSPTASPTGPPPSARRPGPLPDSASGSRR